MCNIYKIENSIARVDMYPLANPLTKRKKYSRKRMHTKLPENMRKPQTVTSRKKLEIIRKYG